MESTFIFNVPKIVAGYILHNFVNIMIAIFIIYFIIIQ